MAEDIFGVDCDFGVFAEDDDEEVKFPNFQKKKKKKNCKKFL